MTKYGLIGCVAVCFIASCKAPTLEELDERWGTTPLAPTVAEFDPAGSPPIVPFPLDLLFLGSEDGTMNIPVPDAYDFADPRVQLNSLDGFSTLGPMDVTFSGKIKESTLIAGDTIRVFEVNKSSPYLAINGIVRELVGGKEFSVHLSIRDVAQKDAGGNELLDENGSPLLEERHGATIIPTVPLKGSTSYLVVIGTGILDAAGKNIEPDLIYGICKGQSALTDRHGRSKIPIAITDEEAALLDQLRALTNTYEILLGLQAGIGPESIALSWTFTTQSVDLMLSYIAENAEARVNTIAPVIDPTTGQVTTAIAGLTGTADIHIGALEVPYYLDDSNPSAPDNFWRGLVHNFLTIHYQNKTGAGPMPKFLRTIPVLVTITNQIPTPANGWPVTIFQHDSTQNRFNALAIAETMAAVGHAVIAIDLPLHGVNKYNDYDGISGAAKTDSGHNILYPFSADAPAVYETCGECANNATPDPECGDECGTGLCKNMVGGIYANHPSFALSLGPLQERTMGVDSDEDGEVNGAGTSFVNFSAGLNFRDNLRQAASDLIVLRKTIPEMGLFDASNISFVGHGMGASAGVLFLSQTNVNDLGVNSAILASPLSGIARALEDSASIGPTLKAGLAVFGGVLEGSSDYEAFFMALQTAVDPADPINYGNQVTTPTLMFEMVGDGISVPSDIVYPIEYNGRWSATGTSALANQMSLQGTSSSTTSADGIGAIVRFVKGDHASLLDPKGEGVCSELACDANSADQNAFAQCIAPFVAVTTEMHGEMAGFIASGGTTLVVNPSAEINGSATEVVATVEE